MDDTLREAMARAHAHDWNGDTTLAMGRALTALRSARSDIAAILDGEAVAVPVEATGSMLDALTACSHHCDSCHGAAFSGEGGYAAMLAVSPYRIKP